MYKNHLITEHLWSLERNVQHPGGMVNQSMHHVGLCWTYTLLSFSCFLWLSDRFFTAIIRCDTNQARPSQFWMNLLFFFAAEPRHTCTAHEPTPNVTRGTHGANPKNTVLKSPRVEQRNMATGSQYKDLSPTVPRSLRPNHGSVRLESWRLKWNVKGWPTSFWFLGLKWYNLDTVLLCCIKFRWMTSFRLLLRFFWLLLGENPNGRWA